MNQRLLNTAYEHMTNHQLAAAAYAHLGDELESLRIQSAVPRKTYTMLDTQFVDKLERIHYAIYAWAVDYWRLESFYAAAILKMAYAHIKNEMINPNQHLEALARGKQLITAHLEALKEVCQAHGIDYKTILKRNHITADIDITMGVDLEHKAAVIKALETLLSIE